MVGIFLRLLEYHQGILFLTTNRVTSFDEAFHSRISISLQYENLDYATRSAVWKNFFEVSKVENVDVKVLSKHVLNGRQIRNTVRLGIALGLEDKKPVTLNYFERTIAVAKQFQHDVTEIPSFPWVQAFIVPLMMGIGAWTAGKLLRKVR